jgi:hypothetical protein
MVVRDRAADEDYVPEDKEEEEDDDDGSVELPTPVVNLKRAHRSFMSPITPDGGSPAPPQTASASVLPTDHPQAAAVSSDQRRSRPAPSLGGTVLAEIVNSGIIDGGGVVVGDDDLPRPKRKGSASSGTSPWASCFAVTFLFGALVFLFSVILVPSSVLTTNSSAIAAFGRSILQRKDELKAMETTQLETTASLDALEKQILDLQSEVSRALLDSGDRRAVLGGGEGEGEEPRLQGELRESLASLASKLDDMLAKRGASVEQPLTPEVVAESPISLYCLDGSDVSAARSVVASNKNGLLTPEELICRHKKMTDAIRGVEDTLASLGMAVQSARPVLPSPSASPVMVLAEANQDSATTVLPPKPLASAESAARVIDERVTVALEASATRSAVTSMGSAESIREAVSESLQRSVAAEKLKLLTSIKKDLEARIDPEKLPPVLEPKVPVDRSVLAAAIIDEIKMESSRYYADSEEFFDISHGNAIEYSSIMRGARVYKTSFFNRITEKVFSDVSSASNSLFGTALSFLQPTRSSGWDNAWLTSRPFLASFNKEVMSRLTTNFDVSEIKRFGPKVAKHALRLTMGWEAEKTASDPDVVLSHLFPIEYESADGAPMKPQVPMHEVAPGSCYAIAGTSGNISIEFKSPIRPRYVAIYHPPRAHLPPPVPLSSVIDLVHPHRDSGAFVGGLTSAPRDFDVLGWTTFPPSELSPGPLELGSFSFSVTPAEEGMGDDLRAEADGLQYFRLPDSKSAEPVQGLTFRFRSNQGNPLFTCIYRLKVYGDLDK